MDVKEEEIPHVKTARNLLSINWSRLTTFSELTQLMYLYYIISCERTKWLRELVNEPYVNDAVIVLMKTTEVKNGNLRFGSYNRNEDHWKFLAFFLLRAGYLNDEGYSSVGFMPARAEEAVKGYLISVHNVTQGGFKATACVTWKRELKDFSEKILQNNLWHEEKLPEHLCAFKYFLEEKAKVDIMHEGELSNFPNYENVAPWHENIIALLTASFPYVIKTTSEE